MSGIIGRLRLEAAIVCLRAGRNVAQLSEEIDYKVDDLLRLLIEDNHVTP